MYRQFEFSSEWNISTRELKRQSFLINWLKKTTAKLFVNLDRRPITA